MVLNDSFLFKSLLPQCQQIFTESKFEDFQFIWRYEWSNINIFGETDFFLLLNYFSRQSNLIYYPCIIKFFVLLFFYLKHVNYFTAMSSVTVYKRKRKVSSTDKNSFCFLLFCSNLHLFDNKEQFLVCHEWRHSLPMKEFSLQTKLRQKDACYLKASLKAIEIPFVSRPFFLFGFKIDFWYVRCYGRLNILII